jgi:hypothetical protein
MIKPKPVEYIAGKGNFTLSEEASICVTVIMIPRPRKYKKSESTWRIN